MPKRDVSKTTPCPYCADPALLGPPSKKMAKTAGTSALIPTLGRFWKRDQGGDVRQSHEHPWTPGGILRPGYRDGERFVFEVPSDALDEKFAGFTIRLVGVDTHPFNEAPPEPFATAHLRANGGPGPVWNPDYPLSRFTVVSGVTIERKAVRVAAHWWPSHEWRVELRADLAAGPPEARNADLQGALDALEFFRLEARGGPKITDGHLRLIYSIRRPPQQEVAQLLGVTVSGLDRWRRRRGFKSWREVVEHFAPSP